MKWNIIFLVAGVILSGLSKLLQFQFTQLDGLGNLVVIPAATFFTLAILFSIPPYLKLINDRASRRKAVSLAVLACVAVACFQIMLIGLFEMQTYLLLLLIIPILGCMLGFYRLWLRT